jgi:hypothetical protein
LRQATIFAFSSDISDGFLGVFLEKTRDFSNILGAIFQHHQAYCTLKIFTPAVDETDSKADGRLVKGS